MTSCDRARRHVSRPSRNGNNPEIRCRNAKTTHWRGERRRKPRRRAGARRGHYRSRRDIPYPIYAKWADAYKKSTGIGLNYQSIGSGGGIKQITAKTVDFGASDMPLKPEELDKSGMIQFPTVIGGDVPVVNLKEIMPGQLRLSGPLLAEIYLGRIRKWNDPAIAALNPGSACRRPISTWSIAPMALALPSSGRTTCRR